MVRLYVSPEKLQGMRVTLDTDAHRHLIKVLRLGPGAVVQIFDGLGTEIEATIESVGKMTLHLALGARRTVPMKNCAVTLIQSVPRGERMDFIVQKTTELGVMHIVPVVSERGMVKPTSGRRRRWQTIAEEAARQSGRADVPTVAEPVALSLALAAPLPEHRFVLWECERAQSFRRALAEGFDQIALLVGPEGGWEDAEVEAALRAGFTSVSIGPRVLRVETAAMVAVALAQAAAGGLD
jgi:16S rRNA (uracil1498-N3)-methyltransferase